MDFRSKNGEAQTTWQTGSVAFGVSARDGAAVRHGLSDVAFAEEVDPRLLVTKIGRHPTLPLRIDGVENKIAARIWIDCDARDWKGLNEFSA